MRLNRFVSPFDSSIVETVSWGSEVVGVVPLPLLRESSFPPHFRPGEFRRSIPGIFCRSVVRTRGSVRS